MSTGTLLVALVLLIPAVAAIGAFLLRRDSARRPFVMVVACAMIAVAVCIGFFVLTKNHIIIMAGDYEWVSPVVSLIDAVVIIAILYYGVKLREWKIIVPTVLQAAGVIYIELIRKPAEGKQLVNIDNLSMILLLISSILGPLVAIFAIGYMQRHEAGKKKNRQHVFFATIFLFLFAMNALCISDNLMHLYTFWEITTLCSFLLIGYDQNEQSKASARRALWLNSVAGLFFAAGIVFIIAKTGSLSLSGLAAHGAAYGLLGVGVMFICCAGFVKSAQMPFQSWLLGAMVAPTPVSALLHSSTMVKAGVYVVLRMSPLIGGHVSGYLVSLVGAFTFVSAALLAISQSNGKRVLAYSTISNLGLIIACAGLGGPVAISAAVLLIIFHAFSKGLMFLCVGTVELGIGSRDIEDMFGIYSKMPYTTVIMVIGIISMVLPPFGVLITKWLALEAAVKFPLVLLMIVIGSALTIAFWVKWLGAVLTVYRKDKPHIEDIPGTIKAVLGIIAASVLALTALISPISNYIVAPAVKTLCGKASAVAGVGGGVFVKSAAGYSGGFGGVLLLFCLMAAAAVFAFAFAKKRKPRIVPPYACGERVTGDAEDGEFIGPQDKVEHIRMHNYYLTGALNESRLTWITGIISILIILVMFGVS